MLNADAASLKIAIIGGGISGLAAAVALQEQAPEAELTLLESSDRLGGALWTRTETVTLPDGSQGVFLVEQGADSFLVDAADTVDFLRRADLLDDLIQTNEKHRRAFVLYRDKLIPTPEEFALLQPRKLRALLTTPLLSWTGKARAACELFVSRSTNPDESLADFTRRRFGKQIYERLVEPLVAGIFTADGEKLSLPAALPRFAEMEQKHGSLIRAAWKVRKRAKHKHGNIDRDEDVPSLNSSQGSGARYGMFVTPRHGYSSLISALTARIAQHTISLESCVSALEKAGSKWRITWNQGGANQGVSTISGEFDAIILATALPGAAMLLKSVDAKLADVLAEIPAASSAVVSFGFLRSEIEHPLNGFGFVVPQAANRPLLAASFPSVKFPDRAPEGCVLVRAFLGGALQPDLVDLDEDELKEIALAELKALLGARGAPLFSRVARWRQAMPQYHLGHRDRVRTIEERIAHLPGLGLAGNYLRGVGIPHCVRAGEQAAANVIAALKA
ncbi:MAG: protoporphyrinogen oxidase [Pirellulales bacterium]|nr:protoporphyrinogen oxidase [Pirellulales bacterium]